MDGGRFTIPTRVYLTAGERAKLEALLRASEQSLDVLLTDLLAAHLEAQPDPPAEAQPDPSDARAVELERRRRELRRLRVKLNDPYNDPPPWLAAMVADLESEIARLERG